MIHFAGSVLVSRSATGVLDAFDSVVVGGEDEVGVEEVIAMDAVIAVQMSAGRLFTKGCIASWSGLGGRWRGRLFLLAECGFWGDGLGGGGIVGIPCSFVRFCCVLLHYCFMDGSVCG